MVDKYKRNGAQVAQDCRVDRKLVDRLAARFDLHERRGDLWRDPEGRFEHAGIVACASINVSYCADKC